MIIGLTGPAGVGKDTVADYLVEKHGFKKLSWAAPLKAGLAAMGFPEPLDRADKEKVIDGFDFSWRRAAQTLGTEWGRALDADIWIKLVGRIIAMHPGQDFVISDVRFQNEAELVRSKGGHVWSLHGRQADLGDAAGHKSEAGLPDALVDTYLVNDSSVAELFTLVDWVISEATA